MTAKAAVTTVKRRLSPRMLAHATVAASRVEAAAAAGAQPGDVAPNGAVAHAASHGVLWFGLGDDGKTIASTGWENLKGPPRTAIAAPPVRERLPFNVTHVALVEPTPENEVQSIHIVAPQETVTAVEDLWAQLFKGPLPAAAMPTWSKARLRTPRPLLEPSSALSFATLVDLSTHPGDEAFEDLYRHALVIENGRDEAIEESVEDEVIGRETAQSALAISEVRLQARDEIIARAFRAFEDGVIDDMATIIDDHAKQLEEEVKLDTARAKLGSAPKPLVDWQAHVRVLKDMATGVLANATPAADTLAVLRAHLEKLDV